MPRARIVMLPLPLELLDDDELELLEELELDELELLLEDELLDELELLLLELDELLEEPPPEHVGNIKLPLCVP